MAKPLVIVESPAKARTIAGYLGKDFEVLASVGHIRDLPRDKKELQEHHPDKVETHGRLAGIDPDDHFDAAYVVHDTKKKVVADLKRALKGADELILATDEDREGEAIGWHVLEVLQPKVPVRRMVFHEITPHAIREALEQPRDLDMKLVEAQEGRRVLDRLVGWETSPVLWRVFGRGQAASAGRVQSVAVRLIVERERARMAFRAGQWNDLEADLLAHDQGFRASLVELDGRRLAEGRDFDASTGRVAADRDVVLLDAPGAAALADRLRDAPFAVASVEAEPFTERPRAPFTTSTLQQEASRKLRMTAQTAMRVAQRLYENGYITYMRTDSTTLSESGLNAARTQARQIYGAEYVPDVPRRYERKVKNAQEAHEAIRPSGDAFRTPGQIAGEVSRDEQALYDLIWKRTVASQMADARGQTVTVRLGATASDGRDAEFSTSGTIITFRGFLAAYEEGRDDEDSNDAREGSDRERRLPQMRSGDPLSVVELTPDGHSTSPPARYTEPTLVRAMEERGIGRPSTYASILGTIVDRGYVFKRGSALVPSWLAFSVIALLEKHFGSLVDYDFTAEMEEDLDRIAGGTQARVAWLRRFYYGDGEGEGLAGADVAHGGLRQLVDSLGDIDARDVNSIPIGNDIVLRVGRYGPYVERAGNSEDRASVPEDMAPDELTVEKAEELLAEPSGDRDLGVDPSTGRPVVAKSGRYGAYVTEVLPDDAPKSAKPRTGSLFKTMGLDTVTLDQALRLLSLPRVVGVDPESGEEITAQNGRYGPYLKKGTDSRSIEGEERLFDITLEQALAIYAQPKQRGRQSAAPLRELGSDPVTGSAIVVKEGRFGAYITDGETNATLRKADSVESVTIERAAELLAEKRAQGPSTKKRTAKKTAKKTTARKTSAKKSTASKSAAKKGTAKKATAKKAAATNPA